MVPPLRHHHLGKRTKKLKDKIKGERKSNLTSNFLHF